MKHFCIINSKTNIIECIVSVEGQTAKPIDGYFETEIPEHDPSFFGMKYENGKFINY